MVNNELSQNCGHKERMYLAILSSVDAGKMALIGKQKHYILCLNLKYLLLL